MTYGVDPGPDGSDRRSQLLRGVLDMCLLAMLEKEASHGYEAVGRLRGHGFEGVGYGTVYPLLMRLRRLGLLDERTEASTAGPPRKVYATSERGRATLGAWAGQWHRFEADVDALLRASGVAGGRAPGA